MSRALLKHALLLMYNAAKNHIDSYGDGQLPAESDPYTVQSADGVHVDMYSNLKQRQYLTYSIVQSAMRGVWHVLVVQKNHCTATFEIYEVGLGKVGGGSITSA